MFNNGAFNEINRVNTYICICMCVKNNLYTEAFMQENVNKKGAQYVKYFFFLHSRENSS